MLHNRSECRKQALEEKQKISADNDTTLWLSFTFIGFAYGASWTIGFNTSLSTIDNRVQHIAFHRRVFYIYRFCLWHWLDNRVQHIVFRRRVFYIYRFCLWHWLDNRVQHIYAFYAFNFDTIFLRHFDCIYYLIITLKCMLQFFTISAFDYIKSNQKTCYINLNIGSFSEMKKGYFVLCHTHG